MQEKLHLILKLAAMLLSSGAEISRVEESIVRMCQAYGAKETHAYATTSQILVTVETEDGLFTENRRPARVGMDMTMLDRINNLIRQVSATAPDTKALADAIDALPRARFPWYLVTLAQGVVAASFCIFFGARTVVEFFAALIIGLLLGCVSHLFDCVKTNRLFNSFMLSFLLTTLAFGATRFGIVVRPDFIIIGYIMNLIPGAGLTGALRDLFVGDVFTGMSRMLEAVLLACAIAFGFVTTVVLFGGVA